jgi:O-antigen ligase
MAARPESQDRPLLALGWLVTAFVLIVPLAVTPGLIDRYRVVKESLVRLEGILGALVIVAAAALAGTGRLREMLRERAVVAVTAAGVAWATLTTLLSTHRGHSADSLATFFGCVLVFAAAWYAAPRISLAVLDLLVPAVLVNAVLAAMQEYGIYQPFYSNPLMPRHLTATGLIGNPNIVGSFMTLATVVFAGAATRVHGWRRWLYAFGAVCGAAGALVSETRTAVIALVGGLLLLAIGTSVRRALVLAAAALSAFAISVAVEVPVMMEVLALPQAVATRSLDAVSSGRVAPLTAGLEMLLDHPITGTGPGTYAHHFMPYKVRASSKYGVPGIVNMNFGEAHNDHVQLLAETGVPGYLLFLGTVFVLVRAVRRSPEGSPRSDIARGLIVPLAGTLLVLCLAQFPLYVPVTRHLIVTLAGLLIGWSRT